MSDSKFKPLLAPARELTPRRIERENGTVYTVPTMEEVDEELRRRVREAEEAIPEALNVRVFSPSEALAQTLDLEFPDDRGEISFEYVGDLTYIITAPPHIDTDELKRLVRNVLPVNILVKVRRP